MEKVTKKFVNIIMVSFVLVLFKKLQENVVIQKREALIHVDQSAVANSV